MHTSGYSRAQEEAVYTALRRDWSSSTALLGVSHLLPRTVKTRGSVVALSDPKRDITYRQWWGYARHLAADLAKQGVKQGDRVVLYAHNSPEFYGAYFAIWHLGAIVVPLNVYLHETEMRGILADAQPKLLITSAELHDKLAAVADKRPIEILSAERWHTSATFKGSEQPVAFAPDDTAVILYTSGTTGVPKGVMLSSSNVMTNALQALARFNVTVGTSPDERFFSVLPLFHVFAQNACMWLPVMLGASIIIVPRIERRAILAGLEKRPTLFFGFPALYGLLVLMKTAPLEDIKMFVSGADAMPDKIRAAFALVYGRNICSGYGLTEAAPVIAVDGVNQDAPTNVVGNPLIGIECSIRDENGAECAAGEVGTLWVKGGNIMKGYYNAPEQTAAVLVDGWLNTGDLARFNVQGEIAISGRSKDLIINKGFNIYPQEVENILLRYPAVIKAAVVGKAEGDAGQVPVAYVAVRDGETCDVKDLSAFCRQNLAPYKVPRTITCLDDLPMTATGKIDKKQLSQR